MPFTQVPLGFFCRIVSSYSKILSSLTVAYINKNHINKVISEISEGWLDVMYGNLD